MKFFFKTSLLTFSSIIILLSCKKEDTPDQELKGVPPETESNVLLSRIGTDSITYYTRLFLKDTLFSNFLKKSANGTLDIISQVKSKCGVSIKPYYQNLTNTYSTYDQIDSFYLSHNIDTTSMLDKKGESLASLTFLYAEHRDFFKLNENFRKAVIDNVIDSLSSTTYRTNNATDSCVSAYLNFYNRISNNGAAGRLTQGEVQDCLKDALGDSVIGLAFAAGQIYNAIANSSLSWSEVRSLARKSFKNILGGAVVSSAISFGWCILWDTID